MKQLFFILFLAIASLFANAQTGTGTLDASGSTVTGGDGSGKIVSAVWTIQGTPPASVTYANPNAIKTDVTFTKAGTYNFLVTITDNLGNVATGNVEADVFNKQAVIVNVSNSKIQVILK